MLRTLRTTRGMSQEDVAQLMTTAGHPWRQPTVAKTEAGGRPVRLDEAAALARCFGVTVNDLAGQATSGLDVVQADARYRIALSVLLHAQTRANEAERRVQAAERERAESLAVLRSASDAVITAQRAMYEARGYEDESDL